MQSPYRFVTVLLCLFAGLAILAPMALAQDDLSFDDEDMKPAIRPVKRFGEGMDQEIALREAKIKYAWEVIENNLSRRDLKRNTNYITKFLRRNIDKYVTVAKDMSGNPRMKYSLSREKIVAMLILDWPRLKNDLKYDTTIPTKNQSMIILWRDTAISSSSEDLANEAITKVRQVFQKHYRVKSYVSLKQAILADAALSGIDPNADWAMICVKLLHNANLAGSLSGTVRSQYNAVLNCSNWYANLRLEFRNRITSNTMMVSADSLEMTTGEYSQYRFVPDKGIGRAAAQRKVVGMLAEYLAKKMLPKIRDEIAEQEVKESYFKVTFMNFGDEDRRSLRQMINKLGRNGVWKVKALNEYAGELVAELDYSRGSGLNEYILAKFEMFNLKVHSSGPGYIKFIHTKADENL